jgi:dihydrofolate reductase
MRKVVLYTLTSLDGAVDQPSKYFTASAEPGQPPEFDSVMEENEAQIISSQDVVLLGRNMYDEWSEYWPSVQDSQFAEFINTVKKLVVTSSPLATEWKNATVFQGPLADLVRDLKAQPGGDIGIHGSIQLAQSMLRAQLVDELQLVVAPAIGFGGRRLFDSSEVATRLELLSTRRTPSGSLLLAYRLS